MNVGFLGLGLIGKKRARAVAEIGRPHRVVAVHDPDADAATSLAEELGYGVERSPQSLLARPDLDVVCVAVPHHLTKTLAVEALRAGKRVFCEKPLGRNLSECESIVQAAADSRSELGVGFNYRFYPAVRQAKQIICAGGIGEPTHMRCILGHGARPGYEREWKTSKDLCGGGVLLDPGIHLIDLVQFLMGPIRGGSASLFRAFWPLDVEDNAFVTLQAGNGRLAHLHVSTTAWKSEFEVDVFGSEGCLQVRGRGGFYGSQTLRHTVRWGWASSPAREDVVTDYGLDDISFQSELQAFLRKVETGEGGRTLAGAEDARGALAVVERLYERSSHDGLALPSLAVAAMAANGGNAGKHALSAPDRVSEPQAQPSVR